MQISQQSEWFTILTFFKVSSSDIAQLDFLLLESTRSVLRHQTTAFLHGPQGSGELIGQLCLRLLRFPPLSITASDFSFSIPRKAEVGRGWASMSFLIYVSSYLLSVQNVYTHF